MLWKLFSPPPPSRSHTLGLPFSDSLSNYLFFFSVDKFFGIIILCILWSWAGARWEATGKKADHQQNSVWHLKIQVKGGTKSTIKFTHVNHYLINASAKLSYLMKRLYVEEAKRKKQQEIFEKKSHQQTEIKKEILSENTKPIFSIKV